MVFGGISKDFIHASNTETFLNGKSLKNIQTLKGALESLKNEAIPVNDPLLASTEYRAHLVQALFYRVNFKQVHFNNAMCIFNVAPLKNLS